jgi:hypothetical protein
MTYIHRLIVPSPSSLLSLSNRLMTLALEIDRAGLGVASEHLLHLASQVLDHPETLRASDSV